MKYKLSDAIDPIIKAHKENKKSNGWFFTLGVILSLMLAIILLITEVNIQYILVILSAVLILALWLLNCIGM